MTDREIEHLAEETAARVLAALTNRDQGAAVSAVRDAIKKAVAVAAERKDDEFQEREGS